MAKKTMSRPQRWLDAAVRASEATQELQDLQEEYQEWRDNLPDNLEGSAVAERLEAVTDLDIEAALDTLLEAEATDLPLGFGRD